jgi:ribonuclease P protein component
MKQTHASKPLSEFLIARAIGKTQNEKRSTDMKLVSICENHLYSKAYAKGKRAVTSAVAVYILPDYAAKKLAKAHPQRAVVNRIGLTVSTKIGGAVVRSRVRRILREGLYGVMKRRKLKVGFLIVIAARSAAVDLKSCDIEKHLDIAFDKLGMFSGL